MKTLAALIKNVALRHGVPAPYVGGFVRDTIEEITYVMDAGGDVKVRGLGTFRWQKTKGRPGSGAYSGPIPDGWKLRFIPCKRLRARRTKLDKA